MDLSLLDAGTLKIVPVQQDFQRIVEGATLTLQLACPSHQLVFDIAPNLPSVYVDARRIVQVLINLTDNAAKFSPPSSQITISAHLIEERLQVDVSDQGIGIPSEAGERVFEAFQQLWNADPNASGLGLGLAICNAVITAHGEDIWVQKKDPPGATISFTLPTVQFPATS
jgi:two-component system sensor histidine kinase KdpD